MAESRDGVPAVANGLRISSKSPCQQVVFIGAQGSGETYAQASGLGGPVYEAWLKYADSLPDAAIGYYPVPYPAAPADVVSLMTKKYRAVFYASIDSGVKETINFIRSRKACGSEHYVFAGYSQGAMALERAAHRIFKGRAAGVPKRTANRIDGLILIASGDRIASAKNVNYGTAPVSREARGVSFYAALLPKAVKYEYPPVGRLVGPRVHEVCMRGDLVCDTDLKRLSKGIKMHSNAYSRWGSGKLGGDARVFVRSAATNVAKTTRKTLPRMSFPGVLTGRVSFDHPTWGRVSLVTSFKRSSSDPYSSAGEGFITVGDPAGRTVWSMRTGDGIPYYEMALNRPAMDKTGQIFINWNPGRYNGVTILQPTVGGFNDHQTLMDEGDYNGRFYYAEVVDLESDGVFEIAQHRNDCNPSCAGGTTTTVNYFWTGSDYESH